MRKYDQRQQKINQQFNALGNINLSTPETGKIEVSREIVNTEKEILLIEKESEDLEKQIGLMFPLDIQMKIWMKELSLNNIGSLQLVIELLQHDVTGDNLQKFNRLLSVYKNNARKLEILRNHLSELHIFLKV